MQKTLIKSLAIFSLAAVMSACSGNRPASLGGIQTSLDPCPESPNCVSSLSPKDDETHYIAPINTSNAAASMKQIAKYIDQHPSAEVIVASESYIYAEFTSALMGFVDDVEFLHKPSEAFIDLRSASRLGHSDLGVNRERIEEIRAALVTK